MHLYIRAWGNPAASKLWATRSGIIHNSICKTAERNGRTREIKCQCESYIHKGSACHLRTTNPPLRQRVLLQQLATHEVTSAR
jgi:hypothetical protein